MKGDEIIKNSDLEEVSFDPNSVLFKNIYSRVISEIKSHGGVLLASDKFNKLDNVGGSCLPCPKALNDNLNSNSARKVLHSSEYPRKAGLDVDVFDTNTILGK